uniref:Uncharacterized protein ymr315W n=1 Tax=Nakaseomyces delphensis TaxID=51657 RepID=Q708A2_NAKDE|nr:hypothetical protein [Nakaseomyces delphensis]
MAPLNVGIIGTGIFATDRHLPSYQEMPDKFKVVAAFNRTKSKAVAFGEKAGLSKDKVYDDLAGIVNDPEVQMLDMLLPAQFNLDTVKRAIEAGKPVLLEKPIAATMAQAREIVKLADSVDTPIGIAENWLYLPCIDVARPLLEKIGPIVAFTHNSTGPFVTQNKYLSTSWRQNPEHIGGFLSDGGVHQLALVTELVGEIASVSALTRQVRKESGTVDIVFSTVEMRNSDIIGTFTYGSAFGATDKSVFLKIYGKNGTVVVELSDKKKPVVKARFGSTAEEGSEEEIHSVPLDDTFGVNAEFLNFHDTIVKKDKNVFKSTPRVAFHHLACVAAFLESSEKNGDHVKVESI